MLGKKSNNPKCMAFELSLHMRKNATTCKRGKKNWGNLYFFPERSFKWMPILLFYFSEPFCYNRTTNTMPARSKTSIDDFRKGSNNHRALNAPASISRATYVSNWDLKVSASQPNSSLIKPQTDMDGEVKFG